METITLNVEGMTCMGCVNNVKKILTPMPGVKNVEIKLEGGLVKIEFDQGKSKIADFKTAIEDAGYDVKG